MRVDIFLSTLGILRMSFSHLKEMISTDKDRRRTKQIILNAIIAIEKGQDLVTLPNLIAVDFYINLGLKK